jgi:uncharacterized phiE125 gp8 family phage protein
MTARVLTHPTTWGVTVAEAKEQARVLTNAEDALVARHLAASLAYCEHFTNRAFEPQVWEIVLDRFPAASGAIEVPGRLIAVSAVSYADAAGDPQVMDPLTYVLDTISTSGWILPVTTWPAPIMATINAVRVVATVGDGTPPDVKQAIVMLAAHYYAEREGAAIPDGVTTILMRHLRYAI